MLTSSGLIKSCGAMSQIDRQRIVGAFGLVLVEMAHKWRRVLDGRLRPKGMSQATWRTLLFISHAESDPLQKDIAIAAGIEGPSLVRLLDALERDGLIERRVVPTDRRGKTVHLTPAGGTTVRDLQSVADDVRARLLEGIPEDQLIACMGVFEAIKRNAEAYEKPQGAEQSNGD